MEHTYAVVKQERTIGSLVCSINSVKLSIKKNLTFKIRISYD